MAPPSIADLFSLREKHALVTGGGSGIGRLVAETLAEAGARITVVGRRREKLDETVRLIQARGGDADGMECDVSDLESIAPFMDKVASQRGTVDVLVNGAGENPRLPIAQMTAQRWRQVIDVNLSSAFFCAQAAAPAMAARGWGRILNIASLQCRLAFTNGAAYGAGKGGVAQLTRAMANEWSAQGINANALAPGFFPTDMTAPVLADNPDTARQLMARTAIGRNGELQDLRGAVLLLTTAASDYITGQVLFVDGGFSVV